MKNPISLLALALLASTSLPSQAVAPTHGLTVTCAFPDPASARAFNDGVRDANADITMYGKAYYDANLYPPAYARLQALYDDGDYESLEAYYLRGYISRY